MEQQIIEKLKLLPAELQAQVLQFVIFLLEQQQSIEKPEAQNEYDILLQKLLLERLENAQQNPERITWQALKQKLVAKHEL